MKKFHSPCWSLHFSAFCRCPPPPFTGPLCLVYPNACVMGRDREYSWERPPSPSSCEASVFLYKVKEKPQIIEGQGATDRQMKDKWNINTCPDTHLWCAHPQILSCPLPFPCMNDHALADFRRGITIKSFLTMSSFHFFNCLYTPLHPLKHTHSSFTHTKKHPLSLFFIGPFVIWLSSEIWPNESPLR